MRLPCVALNILEVFGPNKSLKEVNVKCLPATAIALAIVIAPPVGRAELYNLRVVTDASPDYSDLPSMVHSITAKW